MNDINDWTEAPEDAPLGQIAFPHERPEEMLPPEEDTFDEMRLRNAINMYVLENVPLSKWACDKIQMFLKNGFVIVGY